MLVHSVYFWLDPARGQADRAEFVKGLESLKGIEVVQDIFIGPPAPTTRPAVDRTYSFALTLFLEDMDAHAVYQEHPLHKAFLQKFVPYWIKVTIFDSDCPPRS